MPVKTVKVKRKDHPNDFVVINECDMAKDDELFVEKPAEAPKALTVKQLQKELKKLNVEFDKKADQETLQKLFDENKPAE